MNHNKVLTGIAREIKRVYTGQMKMASPLPPAQGKQIKILSITASPDDVDDIFYEKEQDTLLNCRQLAAGWL